MIRLNPNTNLYTIDELPGRVFNSYPKARAALNSSKGLKRNGEERTTTMSFTFPISASKKLVQKACARGMNTSSFIRAVLLREVEE